MQTSAAAHPLLALVSFALLSATLLFADAGSLDARSRDSDASRLQARKIELPATHSDRLAPPQDSVDWRYFTLDEPARVSLSATVGADDAHLSIGLSTAAGREVASASAARKRASIARRLEQGVYYIRVEAERATSYTLSVGD